MSASGTKYDGEKPMMDLLEPPTLIGIAKVFTYGAKKYARNNYKGGIEHWRLYGAMQRHLNAYWAGEENDPESGLSHLYHAGCCLFMLDYMRLNRPDLGPKADVHKDFIETYKRDALDKELDSIINS